MKLDAEAWDRLITWIDLNAPCHGTWAETTRIPGDQCQRRIELRKLYDGLVENGEAVPEPEAEEVAVKPVMPQPEPPPPKTSPTVEGWPFGSGKAKTMQSATGSVVRNVDLGDGVNMEFVRIPAGSFVMGDTNGSPDERQLTTVIIDQAFWMAKCEVSNEQFTKFNPRHDSRFEHRSSWIFSEDYLGWPLNQPEQRWSHCLLARRISRGTHRVARCNRQRHTVQDLPRQS